MKIIGKTILSLLCFLIVLFCGFYSAMIAAQAAGMPPSDWSLEPLVHGCVGAIAGGIFYTIIFLRSIRDFAREPHDS